MSVFSNIKHLINGIDIDNILNEVKSLKISLASAKKELSTLKSSLTKKKNLINQLKEKNETLSEDVERERNKYSLLEKKTINLSKSNNVLNNKIEIYKESEKKYDKENESLKKENISLLNKVKFLEEKIELQASLEQEQIKLKQQIISLQRSVNGFKTGSIRTKEALEQKNVLIVEQRNELKELRKRLEHLKLENDVALKTKESIIGNLQSELNKLKSLATEQSSKIEDLARQADETKSLYEKEKESKDEEKKELERQNQALEEEVHDLKQEAKFLENEVQTKDQNIRSIGEELTNTRNQIADLEVQLGQNKEILTQNEKEISALNKSLEEGRLYSDNLKTELENLKKQLEDVMQNPPDKPSKPESGDSGLQTDKNMPQTRGEDESATGVTGEKDFNGVDKEPTHRNKRRVSNRKSKEEEAIEQSDGTIENFPPITNDSKRNVKRSIEYVYDRKKVRIYADEFFARSAEEIARISRKLVEVNKAGETEYVCGMCHRPVKMAHRTINGKESLFFAHAKKGDNFCPWIPNSTSSKDDVNIFEISDEDENPNPEDMEKSRSRLMKETIFSLLTSDASQKLGISNVKMDTIVRSSVPYMKWRRPDLSFRYNDKEVVILLQRESHDLSTIVDRDVFFQLNNMYVIWVFGADSGTSYDYMRGSNYKNTMFDNHRNVFVFDSEAQEKSEENDLLMLKCNWLDENDEWSINLSKDQKNGQILSLEELRFEENSFKPYYVEANLPYFGKHPETLESYLQSHHTREELLKMFEDKWLREPGYEEAQQQMRDNEMKATPFCYFKSWGFRFKDVTLIQPVFTEQPKDLGNGYYMVKQNEHVGLVNYYGQKVLDWSGILKCDDLRVDTQNNRILFLSDSLWGVADIAGHVLINPQFDYIKHWTTIVYRVMKNHKWGLCDINNQVLADCIYESIGDFTSGQAEATLADCKRSWITYSGFIDENGNAVTLSTPLDNGFFIVEQFERKGISDKDYNIIIPIEYEDILSWTSDAYRVKKNGKWGVIRNDNIFIIPVQYDLIDKLFDGHAKTIYMGVESIVDAEGQTIAQKEVQLLEGLKKTKEAGKWGIVNGEGNKIVQHKYDEIGAFRQRLIGIINGHVIKLDAYYDYQIQITGKCISHQGKSSIIDVGGVICTLPDAIAKQCNKDIHVGVTYEDLAFGNLMFGQKNFQLKIVPNERLNKKATHGDRPNDFSDKEIVTGLVASFKKNKGSITKLLVSIEDGRETMVPRRFFKNANLNITDWKIGDTIILQKTGFDDELDQTLWSIIINK